MRKLAIVALTIAAFSGSAIAQTSQATKGVQIKGNTEITAKQETSTAIASGEGNVAKNSAGAIKDGVQINGNTKIKASQKNSTAVASGKNNSATNEAGVIGGK